MALVFMLLSFISIVNVFVIDNCLDHWSHYYTFIFSLYFLSLLIFFFYITKRAATKRAKVEALTSANKNK